MKLVPGERVRVIPYVVWMQLGDEKVVKGWQGFILSSQLFKRKEYTEEYIPARGSEKPGHSRCFFCFRKQSRRFAGALHTGKL